MTELTLLLQFLTSPWNDMSVINRGTVLFPTPPSIFTTIIGTFSIIWSKYIQ